jgi:hypothetical protein
MLQSEKVAIAAHLHVLLRRKTGRVTDVEWLAVNEAYATEIIRFARASAQQDGHADLAEWAGKLEAVVLPKSAAANGNKTTQTSPPAATPEAARYVRGIR